MHLVLLTRLCLLNAGNKILSPPVSSLIKDKRIWTDFAMLEGVFGIERVVKALGSERIMLGTHASFYAVESSILKLKESQLSTEIEAKLKSQNAVGLLMQ